MRQSIAAHLLKIKYPQPGPGGHKEILNGSEDIDRRPDMGLFGSVMVAGDQYRPDLAYRRQTMKLFGGGGDDRIERADTVEEVTRKEAEVRFDLDYPFNGLGESAQDVFLAQRQTAASPTGM